MLLYPIIKNSAKLPKKEALFSLNRVSMRDTLVYLFILFFICFLPNVLYGILNFETSQIGIDFSQYLLTILIFYPFFTFFIVIILISFLAFGGSIIRWVTQRKLAYQQLWKMTSYAIFWPLILYQLMQLLPVPSTLITLLCLAILYAILYKMISIYPKRRV